MLRSPPETNSRVLFRVHVLPLEILWSMLVFLVVCYRIEVCEWMKTEYKALQEQQNDSWRSLSQEAPLPITSRQHDIGNGGLHDSAKGQTSITFPGAPQLPTRILDADRLDVVAGQRISLVLVDDSRSLAGTLGLDPT